MQNFQQFKEASEKLQLDSVLTLESAKNDSVHEQQESFKGDDKMDEVDNNLDVISHRNTQWCLQFASMATETCHP